MDKLAEGGQMFKENIATSVSKSDNIVVAATRTIIVGCDHSGTTKPQRHERSNLEDEEGRP